MQVIRFGAGLDGERGWHPQDALGVSTLGPLGMLSLLETQLGLLGPSHARAERVVQMRNCLAEARTGARFYEGSFEADELGTAAALLDWRDHWYERGWSGKEPGDLRALRDCARIADLVAVEALARGRVAPGIGQRLNAVARVLSRQGTQIEAVTLVEPLSEFPLAWRRVLERLPLTRQGPVEPTPAGPDGSMLAYLQAALLRLSAEAAFEPLRWVDDGTVTVVRADSMLAAAEWLAAELRSLPAVDRVLVAEQEGSLLDAALAALDQPRQGLAGRSAARPALQLIALALRLLWEPLDCDALLQFLTHPIAPIRRYARGRLAEKMAQAPGIGGAQWDAALQDIAERYGAEGHRVCEQVAQWLQAPRFRMSDGAPIDAVVARLAQLEDFFRTGAIEPDTPRGVALQSGLAPCRALRGALELLRPSGGACLRPETLERLVQQALGAGAAHPLTFAEAGAGARVTSPAAVIEPFDEVVWWAMRSVALVEPYPWPRREREALQGLGIELPDLSQLLAQQARGWLRAVLAARQHLVLVLPPESEEPHPLWQTIAAICQQPTIRRVEATLQEAPRAGMLAKVAYRPLPARRRWWQVPKGTIHRWELTASYTSLEQFVHNPWQWALNYPAALRVSPLFEVPDGPRLFGLLAHRAIERLYRQPDALGWPDARVRSWIEGALPGILVEEGARLLMPGHATDRAQLVRHLVRAIGRLHELLQNAGAVAIDPECRLRQDTPLGPLEGTCDLRVTLRDKRQVVIDLKWSGQGYRRVELRDGQSLQLAIYARLVQQDRAPWPAVAYFILQDAQLLTADAGVFPGVGIVAASPGATASPAVIWPRLEASWRWRREQIEAGRIEVVLSGLPETPESTPPPQALRPKILREDFNPFMALAGWEPDR